MARAVQEEVKRTMVRTVCRHLGVGELPATALINNVMKDLRENHGGEEIYVPIKPDMCRVVEMVRAAYTGTNMQEVCDRFGISKSTFYRYLGREVS